MLEIRETTAERDQPARSQPLAGRSQAVTAPDVDAGVIEEARRRHHRQRGALAASLIAAAAAAGLTLGLIGGARHTRPPVAARNPTSPVRISGAPLGAATHLSLIASENGGQVFVVNVDRATARAVPGLGVPASRQTLSSPTVWLDAVPGGVVATVAPKPCQPCERTNRKFLIDANGAVRRLDPIRLKPDQYTTAEAVGSTTTWVLTWPSGGHCTLALEPATRPPVPVACGSLQTDTPAGLLERTGSDTLLVNPQTGEIRERVRGNGGFDLLGRGIALTSVWPSPGDSSFPTNLGLLNLATGARRALAWPSILHFGYQVYPEPHGPLVAVEFVDPAYPPHRNTIGQAADVWMLDPRSGHFTHVPGFPIFEGLKASHVAWTADDRLVTVVANDGGPTLAVWRPGQPSLRIRRVPAIEGYSNFVPLSR
jgi:hypothetical protein